MKLKGIGWFEQNVEKIVLGVVGVVALGAVALQVLMPNRVKVGGRDNLRPAQVYQPVEEAADQALAKMNSGSPTLPETPKVELEALFSRGLGGGTAPRMQIASLGASTAVGQAEVVERVAENQFAPLAVPACTGVVAASFRNTIDPREPARHPELAKLLPSQQPFDKAAVSVEGVFDGTALRAALQGDPDGDGPMIAMPRSWWQDPLSGVGTLAIVGVELEREVVAVAPGSSGRVGDTLVIASLPGRDSGLAVWETEVKALGDVAAGISMVGAMQDSILRPKYYLTIAGPAWDEPAEMAARADESLQQRDIERLKRREADLAREIEELEQILASLPEQDAGAPRPEREPANPGGPRRGPTGPRGAPTPEATQPAGNRAVVEGQIRSKTRQRERVVRQLEDLGVKVEVAPATGAQPTPGSLTPPSLLDESSVKLWAHDVGVTPGDTYRYRVRVVTNNPLFGQRLQASQADLAGASLARGAWSEWSEPVMVDPDRFFAVTSAAVRDVASPLPRATAEMYTYYYGYYRRAVVSLEPGDSVVGVAKLPELKTYDPEKLASLEPDQGAPQPAWAPEGRPGERPLGRPGQIAPIDPGRDPRIGREPPPAPGEPGADPLAAAVRESLPRELTLRVEAIFMDVLTQSAVTPSGVAGAGGRESVRAIFRDVDGALVLRNPETERTADLFKRLEASAKAGLTQGAQVQKDEPTRARPDRPGPNVPTPPARPPTRPGGGGGGGGGGG